MTDQRKPWYCECGACGERWKVATLPLGFNSKGFKALMKMACPNCQEGKSLSMCATDGPGAVLAPRRGRKPKEPSP